MAKTESGMALCVLSRPDIWQHVADWLELRHRTMCWLVCGGLRQAADVDGFDYPVANLCVQMAGVGGPHRFANTLVPKYLDIHRQILNFAQTVCDWHIEAEGWMYCALFQGSGSWMYRGAAKTRIAKYSPYTVHRGGGWKNLELMQAALRGDVGAVREHAEEATVPLHTHRDVYRMTMAHNAAWNGHVECLRVLLDKGPALATDDGPGLSMLHVMVCRGHFQGLARMIVDYGLDPDVMTNDRKAPIHFAIAQDHVECLDELVQAGADTEIAPTFQQMTPLLCACVVYSPQCVRALVAKHRVDLDAMDSRRRGVLHLACHHACDECMNDLLHAWGARPLNRTDWVGNTPLHFAVESGAIECAHAIIAHAEDMGTNVEWLLQCANMHGMTPLHLACKEGTPEMTRFFMIKAESCASMVDTRGYTPLHWAARCGHRLCIEAMFEHGTVLNVNAVATHDLCSTPLHCAVRYMSNASTGYLSVAALARLPETDLHAVDANGFMPIFLRV